MKATILRLNIDDSKRVFGLDLYRAVAILIVVQVHGSFLLNNTILEGFPWIKTVDGVELFFALSGFLIGSILIKKCSLKHRLAPKDLMLFWKRRWFRTLPNYYLILLANWLVVNNNIISEDIKQFNLKFLFFLQNFAHPMYGFFWESWSLSVEEWFYILFPIILSVSLLFLTPKKGFLLAALLFMIVPLLYRIKISFVNVDPFWWDVTFRKMVLTRLDAIGYGIAAAWIKFYYPHFWKKARYISGIAGLLLMIIIVQFHFNYNDFFTKTFSFVFTSIAAMFLLPFADQLKQLKGRFGRIITHISVISYSMYLLNLALVAEVIKKNFPPVNAVDSVLKYIVYWMIVITASTLLYKYFEKPFTDLRDKKIGDFRTVKIEHG